MDIPKLEKFGNLEACYGQLVSWCDLLEAIADFLPCHLDERLCDTMATGLVPLMQKTHWMEEQMISAGLRLIMSDGERAEAEERRRSDRIFDLDNAREVVEVLTSLKSGACRLSWDAVGYLLCSFFCSMRKHIKGEREIARLICKALADNETCATSRAQTAVEAA